MGIRSGLWGSALENMGTHTIRAIDFRQRLLGLKDRHDDDELLRKSNHALNSARYAHGNLEDARDKYENRGQRRPLGLEQVLAIIGGVAAYLGIFTYAVSYVFFRNYYDRVLPGMDVPYPYGSVLEAVWQKGFALAAILLPALVILSRYLKVETSPLRPTAIRASHAASVAMIAYWHLRKHSRPTEVARLREELKDEAKSIMADMPDGYWTFGVLLQSTRMRTIWTVLVLVFLLCALSCLTLYFGDRPIGFVLQWQWMNEPPGYLILSVVIFGVIAAGAALIASAFHVAQLALECHYCRRPTKRFRRRVVLTALGLTTITVSVFFMARTYGVLHIQHVASRFPRVAVALKEPALAANGVVLAPDDVRSLVDSNTACGYLINVPMSDDVYLRLTSTPRPSNASTPTGPVCVRIPKDQVLLMSRGSGPYDTGP